MFDAVFCSAHEFNPLRRNWASVLTNVILFVLALVLTNSQVSAQEWLSYDGIEMSDTSETGLVLIGIDEKISGRIDPSFRWRAIDADTGKLLPLKTTGTGGVLAGTDMKKTMAAFGKALSNPFVAFTGDKRVRANKNGFSFRMTELLPGTYVLESVTLGGGRGLSSVFGGRVPIVRVLPGKVTYAGTYAINIDRKSGATARESANSEGDAKAFLAQYKRIKDTSVASDSTFFGLLSCAPEKIPLAPVLYCGIEDSNVKVIDSVDQFK